MQLAPKEAQKIESQQLLDERITAIQQVLTQSTPIEAISYKSGRGGKMFAYADHAFVTRTLNQAFGWDWDFEVDNEEVFTINGKPCEVRVRGRLTVRMGEKSIVKMQFGGKKVEFIKGTDEPVSLSDCFKSATSDALKKCASLLGIALDLYDADNERSLIIGEMKAIFLENSTVERWEEFYRKRNLARIKDNAQLENILDELTAKTKKAITVQQVKPIEVKAESVQPVVEIKPEVIMPEDFQIEKSELNPLIESIWRLWPQAEVKNQNTGQPLELSAYLSYVLKVNSLQELDGQKLEKLEDWLKQKVAAKQAMAVQAPQPRSAESAEERALRIIDEWDSEGWQCTSVLQERLAGLMKKAVKIVPFAEIQKAVGADHPKKLSLEKCKELILKLEQITRA